MCRSWCVCLVSPSSGHPRGLKDKEPVQAPVSRAAVTGIPEPQRQNVFVIRVLSLWPKQCHLLFEFRW